MVQSAVVAEAYLSVVEPVVFARTDSESLPERMFGYSAAAMCWLEACSSAVAAAPALAVVH